MPLPIDAPLPLPDELLYSVLARLLDRLQPPDASRALREILGFRLNNQGIASGHHLEEIATALYEENSVSGHDLLVHHTLFPLNTAFRTPEERTKIAKEALSGNYPASTIQMLRGRTESAVRLRYCPQCVGVDRQSYGEAYWHRAHVVQGLPYCGTHLIPLIDTDVETFRRGATKPVSLESYLRREKRQASDRDSPGRALAYVNDVQWLLEHPGERQPRISEAYRSFLQVKRLGSYTGVVQGAKLVAAMNAELAALPLSVDMPSEHVSWRKMVNISRRSAMFHLVLLRAIGASVPDFMRLEAQPVFGESPWPCRNPVCDHYGRAVISTPRILHDHNNWAPIGVFRCDCGYEYRVSGDCRPSDNPAVEVTAYGERWLARFKERVDEGASLTAIATELGTDHATIAGLVGQLRVHASASAKPEDLALLESATRPIHVHQKREELTKILGRHPSITREELYATHNSLLRFLLVHDNQWLREALPPPAPPRIEASYLEQDWAARDAAYSGRVEGIASGIAHSPDGMPTRVTATRIRRELGIDRLLSTRGSRLPRTRRAVLQAAETVTQFQVRRVRFVADRALARKVSLTENLLRRLSATNTKKAEQSKTVQRVLRSETNRLASHHLRSPRQALGDYQSELEQYLRVAVEPSKQELGEMLLLYAEGAPTAEIESRYARNRSMLLECAARFALFERL